MKAELMKTVPVNVSVPQPMWEDLGELMANARGRYGNTVPEVAKRLMSERLEQLVQAGVLLPKPDPSAVVP